MIIDCDKCQVRDLACGDCVVNVLLRAPQMSEHVELDDAETRAISVLAGSGLVPPLRLVAGSSPQSDAGGSPAAYDGGRARGATRAG